MMHFSAMAGLESWKAKAQSDRTEGCLRGCVMAYVSQYFPGADQEEEREFQFSQALEKARRMPWMWAR